MIYFTPEELEKHDAEVITNANLRNFRRSARWEELKREKDRADRLESSVFIVEARKLMDEMKAEQQKLFHANSKMSATIEALTHERDRMRKALIKIRGRGEVPHFIAVIANEALSPTAEKLEPNQ